MSEEINNLGESMIPGFYQLGESAYIVIPAEQEHLELLGISTIGVSPKVAEEEGLSASIPSLILPNFYLTDIGKLVSLGLSTGAMEGISLQTDLGQYYVMLDVSKFSMAVEKSEHKAIISLLDQWQESLEVIKERVDQERNSNAYRLWLDQQTIDFFEVGEISRAIGVDQKTYITGTTLYREWVQSLPEVERVQEKNAENRYQILVGLQNAAAGYKEQADAGQIASAPLVMGSMAIGMTFMSDFVNLLSGTIEATTQTGVNTILEAINQMAAPLFEQNLAALGYFGALFAAGTLYQTADEVALNVGKMPPEQVSVKFAKEYAKNIMKLMDNPDFNLFIKSSLVLQLRDGHRISKSEKQELTSAIKLVLLSIAMAVVYKAETGKITAEEFGALLTQKEMIEDDPTKGHLKKVILSMVSQLGTLKEPMLNAIIEYLNSDPKMDELFDVYRVFEGIRQTEAFTEIVHTKRPM